MTIERRRRREEDSSKRQQRLGKPVFYIGKIVSRDGNIVDLGNGRRSVPETMNDAGNAAGDGSCMEKEEVIGIF